MRDFFIKTGRLGFSEWTDELILHAMDLWGDPTVCRLISAKGFFTGDEILARVRAEMNNRHDYGIQYFPLFLLGSDSFIGCCGFRPYAGQTDAFEFGFYLLPKYWGKGYATEASKMIIEYAYGSLGIRNIYAGHHPDNAASAKTLERLGFVYLRDEFYPPTGLDHPLYIFKPRE